MIRLITPPGMLLTVALLAIYCAWAMLIGWTEKSWLMIAGSGACMLAAYGTAMLRPWSRYIVYFVTGGFIAKLFHSVTTAARAGFFGFQFTSGTQAAWSLVPSLMLAMLSVVCCVIVHRHFRRAVGREIPPDGATDSSRQQAPAASGPDGSANPE